MLLVIYNLPSRTKYADVKNIIQKHCGLTNVILDNLVNDGLSKKVTVGVADEADAVFVLRKLNGLLVEGNKLHVEDMRNKMSYFQERPHIGKDKASRWNQSDSADDIPSLFGTSSLNLGQNSSMLRQKTINPNMIWNLNNTIGPNNDSINHNLDMIRQNYSSLGLHSPDMSQNYVMGQNFSMMNENSSMREQDALKGQKMKRGQNSPTISRNSMMGQNYPVMNQNAPIIGLNPLIMGQNKRMGQQGQIAPLMSQDIPVMVPPPLIDPGSTILSGPFYLCPQNNDYRNYNRGQQDPRSKNFGFSDKESLTGRVNPPIPVWNSNISDNFSKSFSSDDSERHESKQSSSARRARRGPEEVYQSVGTRDLGRGVRPWANEPPYARDLGPDRPQDRAHECHSRPDRSGTNAYQSRSERPRSRSHSRSSPSHGSRKGSSRYYPRTRDERSPPAKRYKAERGESHVPPGPPQVNQNRPKKPKQSIKKTVERDVTWRNQATAEIVKDMYTRITTIPTVPANAVLQKMKMAVRSRLMIIVNNRLEVTIPDQLMLYRRRFKTDEDQYLYNRIVRHVLHAKERKLLPPEAEAKDSIDSAQLQTKQEELINIQPVPHSEPVEPVLDRLPKYPQGDKAAYKVQKQQFKKELQLETMPQLEIAMKKALDDEMQAIKDIVLAEAVAPNHEGEVYFCDRIVEPAVTEELGKMLELNVAKRLLNLGTVPLVRILGVPKLPKKAPLDQFLQNRGVVSLKKSDMKPMYIATCDSYENFDKLCALNDAVIDGVKVVFKPMYLTAPVEKVKRKKKQQKLPAQVRRGNILVSKVDVNKPIVQPTLIPVENIEQDFSEDIIIPEVKVTHESKNTAIAAINVQNYAPFKTEEVETKNEEAVSEPKQEHTPNVTNIDVEANTNQHSETERAEVKQSQTEDVEAGTDRNSKADDSDDVILIENVYEKYTIDDTLEVNEEDLEDY